MGSLNKCEIIDGQKVLTPFVETNNGIINGMPLGSWISFEKDAAPNEEWIQAGTTFDADKYPELYLFLGGNVVPSRYDHSRPNYTNVYKGHMAITTVAPTKTQLFEATQSDGVLNVSIYDNGSTAGQVTNRNMVFYVNGVQITESSICSNPAYSGNPYLYRLTLNKGDIVQVARATSNVANDIQLTVSWIPYSHPMFIKASSATSIYTPSDAVRQVKDYVADYVDEKIANANSYSTNETLTGGTWIDGKPIYKKVTPYNGVIESPTLSSSIIINAIVGQPYIDTFISVTYVGRRTSSTGEKMSATFDTWIQSDTTIKVLATSKMYVENIVSLYTKTTD